MSENKDMFAMVRKIGELGIKVYDAKQKSIQQFDAGLSPYSNPLYQDNAMDFLRTKTYAQENVVIEISVRDLEHIIAALNHVKVPRHPTARRAWQEYEMLKSMCDHGMEYRLNVI